MSKQKLALNPKHPERIFWGAINTDPPMTFVAAMGRSGRSIRWNSSVQTGLSGRLKGTVN